MTKSLLFIAFILQFSAPAFAGDDAPAAVQKAFEQKFAGAEKVKWDKEKNTQQYEVSFKWNESKCTAKFKDTGEWLETATKMDFSQLPIKVKKAFSTSYVVGSAKGGAKIESAEGVKYRVDLKPQYKTSETFYTEDGKEL